MIFYKVDGNRINLANVAFWREGSGSKAQTHTIIQFVGGGDNYITVAKPCAEVDEEILDLVMAAGPMVYVNTEGK